MGCKTNSTNSFKPKIDESINLYAFIGKKISITQFDHNENNVKIKIDSLTGDTITTTRYIMDKGFKAKYLVLNNIFNQLKSDTVEFFAYDHYGTPEFEKYDTILLYLSKSKEEGHYFHQKYQFDEIFKDKKGKQYTYPKFWGTMYTPYKDSLKGFDVNLKDKKIPVGNLSKESLEIKYPKEFYKIEDSIAYPYKGISLEDVIVFRLKTMFKDL